MGAVVVDVADGELTDEDYAALSVDIEELAEELDALGACRRSPAEVEELIEGLEVRLPGLLGHLDATGLYEDLDVELGRLSVPKKLTPSPTPSEVLRYDLRFDLDEVERVVRFCTRLRHVKGRPHAGRPFVPDLWQVVYVLAPVFGWVRPDGRRWHTELYLEVPRKAGKSTLAAAMALYLLVADREPGAEVVSAAADRGQARAVFNVAARMASASPALRKRLQVLERSGEILYDATASSYKVLSADKDGRRKHGLNLHGAVIDEIHALTDEEFVGAIETATGSREQPLTIAITTAGIPAESPVWLDKHERVLKACDGTVPSPGLLGVIFAGPADAAATGSWASATAIAEANPGLGTATRGEYLAREVAKAHLSVPRLNRFLRLHLNVPTEASSSWIELPAWDRTASIVDEDDLVGRQCWAGLDLSSALDLTALVLVFPSDDESVDVLARFWTPADTLDRRAHRDRAPYQQWRDAGYLSTTAGEALDYDAIELEVAALLDRYEVVAINYDPWGSKQFRSHLEAAGAPIWELRQGFASLSPPSKELERMVAKQSIRHGGNPVLRWCVSNATVASDPAGNIKPDRKRSRSRIDGVVALIMALEAWQRDARPARSVYEDSRLEVL